MASKKNKFIWPIIVALLFIAMVAAFGLMCFKASSTLMKLVYLVICMMVACINFIIIINL